MVGQLEQIFLASCPFCGYRELFWSEDALRCTYEAHLGRHEEEAFEDGCSGRGGAREWMTLAVLHVRRLRAADDN